MSRNDIALGTSRPSSSSRPNIISRILTVGKLLYASPIVAANKEQDVASKLVKYEKLV
jgi:hypothetical protein